MGIVPGAGHQTWTSVTSFSENVAVVCFQQTMGAILGRCTAISSTGSILLESSNTDFNIGASSYISVGRVTESFGIVCYQDANNGKRGVCNGLLLADANVTSTEDVMFHTGAAAFISVTA